MSDSTRISSRRLYFRLLSYVRPYGKIFALAIFFMSLTSITEPLFPWLMKGILDTNFNGSVNRSLIYFYPIFIIVVFLLRGLFGFCADYAMAWVSNRVVWRLRDEMFSRLMHCPAAFFDNQSSGQIISRLVYDVSSVAGASTSAVTVLIRDSLTVLGLLGWMFYLNWKLTLIAFVMLPMVAMVVKQFSGRLRRMGRLSQTAMGSISHILEESISAYRVIKINDNQSAAEGRFGRANRDLRGYNMRSQIAAGLVTPFVQLFASIALAIIIGVALYQASHMETTVGGFVSFITAMIMMLAPIKRLTDLNAPLQRGLAGAESVFALLDEPVEVDKGTQNFGRARGEIVFSHVNFTYQGAERPSLVDVSFTMPEGKTLALVGASGAGKSTVASLIPRFYNVNGGIITIDGEDITTLSLSSLRQNIALVSQDIVLFNDTVAANIAYGTADKATIEDVRAAAQAAFATDFIEKLPQGFDTVVGERGTKLSGGQRQRIAIARALMKNAPILILDEATSALDTASERSVQAALENLMRNRSTLVIAHRLSTVERADLILVLDHGRIVESGKHKELLAKGGAYSQLHQLQFSKQAAATHA